MGQWSFSRRHSRHQGTLPARALGRRRSHGGSYSGIVFRSDVALQGYQENQLTSWCAMAAVLQNAVVTATAVSAPFLMASAISTLSLEIMAISPGSRNCWMNGPVRSRCFFALPRSAGSSLHSGGILPRVLARFSAALVSQEFLCILIAQDCLTCPQRGRFVACLERCR